MGRYAKAEALKCRPAVPSSASLPWTPAPAGFLIDLLDGRGAAYVPFYVAERVGFISERRFGSVVSHARAVASRLEGAIDVKPRELPRWVRFRDLQNPASIEFLNPNELDKTFGEGVKLSRVTIEMTKDPVTTDIARRVGWSPDVARNFMKLRGISGD